MKWFDKYNSNTIAGGGNQYYFLLEDNEIHKGRIYYKVFSGGTYNYSLLFSNIIDSTFSDGTVSHCNLIGDEWEIVEAALGVCKSCGEMMATNPEQVIQLFFHESKNKFVMPGEFFASDAVEISAKKGEFLCLEISFRGRMIPCHEETILPVFALEGDKWVPTKHVPLPGMLGCDRKVQATIGFLGDSITQGLGTPVNAYTHWNALVAEALGAEYSYWNLGLGYGRAQDAASDGAWLFKAKRMDVIVFGYGINDILQGREEEQIKKDLLTIIQKLKKDNVKVLIQTIPPFDFQGAELEKWLRINSYIRNTLSKFADGIFDVVPILIDEAECECKALYGEHPNEAGCAAWAEALIPVLREFLNN